MLKLLLKKLMKDHIKNKSGIFLCSKIYYGLEKLHNKENPKDLMFKVDVSVMHFRVLHQCEKLMIVIENVLIESVTRVNYPIVAKRRAKGFKFIIPKWLVPTLELCVRQISPNVPKMSYFMLNWNTRIKNCMHNIGEGNAGSIASNLVERLGKKNTKTLTAKPFRRSAAAQLVEAGISIVHLYKDGN